jgi:sodium-independent sulfate anion transporter 11
VLKIPGRGFVNTWKAVFQNVTKIRAIDAAIGFTSLGVILLLRNLRNIKCQTSSSENSNNAESNSPMEVFRQRALWFVTVSRNTIVLLFSSLLAYYLIEVKEMKGVIEVTGNVKGGIPPWRLPWEFTNNDSNLHTNDHIVEMNLNNTFEIHTVKEQTTDTLEGPWEVAVGIGSGLVFLPLVSMIQIIAIVHNFSPPTKQLDASQEIFALGMCQLVGSFAGSLPITASFGRSTVNSASGVQTPFGGIITGLIVIAACSFLTPHFAFIPTASLSAVIISSVVLTIDVEILLPIWRSKKVDIIPYLLTLLVGIFVSVEIGMIVGTSVHLAILLYRSSHPEVWIKQKRVEDTPYILVQPDRSLNFPSVDKIRQKLSEASTTYGKELFPENLTSDSEQPHNFPENEETFSSDSSSFTNGKTSIENLAYPVAIIFDLTQVVDIDFSAASLIRALAKSMKEKNGRTLLFCGATQKVEYIMQGVDAAIFLSYCNIEEAEKKLIRA